MISGMSSNAFDFIQCRPRAKRLGMWLDTAQGGQDVFPDADLLSSPWVDHHAIQSESAGLEAVVGVNKVIVLGRQRVLAQ